MRPAADSVRLMLACKTCGAAFKPNEPIHQPRHVSGNYHKSCIPMNYIELKAGDIRQAGDETQHAHPEPDWGNPTWHPVKLLGHVILPSDLVASNFRRPCLTQ